MKLDIHEFDERDLIRRVLMNMPVTKSARHGVPRWVKVKNTFGVGSTVATALCVEFGLDPNAVVRK